MREVAAIISKVLTDLAAFADVGVNLLDIEKHAEKLMKKYKVKSYNKGYHPHFSKVPYPAILCLSTNEVLAHGVPRDYILKDDDILSIDLGIKYKEVVGDAAITVVVGKMSGRNQRLLQFAKRITYVGIDQIANGVHAFVPGEAMHWYAKKMGFTINENLAGHGIGKDMHEEPSVPMFDVTGKITDESKVPKFKTGQVVCIEPHVTYDAPSAFKDDRDNWGVITADMKNSAMFEHMVEVTKDGYEILTTHFDINDIGK